eukprot:Lithocolla_globosa_v1_NODE_325_length_4469_cov_325.839148.p4 type:complete len:117 gc:universal NODE_325_length_4469_cov_325.839148:4065-4415(+)
MRRKVKGIRIEESNERDLLDEQQMKDPKPRPPPPKREKEPHREERGVQFCFFPSGHTFFLTANHTCSDQTNRKGLIWKVFRLPLLKKRTIPCFFPHHVLGGPIRCLCGSSKSGKMT